MLKLKKKDPYCYFKHTKHYKIKMNEEKYTNL